MSGNPLRVLPHRAPMVMIDSFEVESPDRARAVKTFAPGSYCAGGPVVDQGALIECIAQTVAALYGSRVASAGGPPPAGMLVGVNDFGFHGVARVGVPLEIAVEVTRRLPPFCLASGSVHQAGNLIASGGMKFHISEGTGGGIEKA